MDLTPIFICGFLFLAVYKIVELFARRKERMMLVEKLDSSSFDASRLDLLRTSHSEYRALHIGGLLLGLGAGILLSVVVFELSWCYFNMSEWGRLREYIYACGPLLGSGAGLLAAFVWEQKIKNRRAEADKKA